MNSADLYANSMRSQALLRNITPHNLKVVGSNPTPATNLRARKDASLKPLRALLFSGFRAYPCIYQGLQADAPREGPCFLALPILQARCCTALHGAG